MTNATIQEIEGIDDYWGPAFRSVYEGEGGHEAFVEQLDERIQQHDKEIEKLCNFYYQGFIDSIRELLQVRSHAEELHAEISNVDANVSESTESLCTRAEELIRARRVELNIASTIEKMELCLPLLTTYSKLKTQVEAKRYYPALKTLEQLEHVLLPRVGPYKWCAQISSDIPRLRQSIQDASMADLRDFLENIRTLSPQVGAMAFKETHEMLGRSLANIVKSKKVASRENSGPQCPHELVDFSPLHRCLHIHSVLGAKNDFVQYYRAQRKQQARLVLIPSSGNLHDSIQSMKSYLNAVLGFFILEEHLLTAGAGLVSRDWLLDTWSMSVTKVASTLRTNTSLITDPTLMLSIKQQIMLFINALKFPFSTIVPAVYVQVKEFIYAWLKYSAGLGLGGGRRAAAARHSASLLLSRSFTGCLSALFRHPLPLMQLVQIIVDTQYLEDATSYLYEFISNITGSELVTTQCSCGPSRNQSHSDSTPQLAAGSSRASDIFGSAVPAGFRRDTMRAVRSRRTCAGPEGRRTIGAFCQLEVRINVFCTAACIEGMHTPFISNKTQLTAHVKLSIPNRKTVDVTYREVPEQLLDLITGWDWSSYLHDVGIEGGKYALVTPRDAATLLEKLKEAEQKSSVFSVLKKNERDRRKLLDTVLKQLKQLQNQDG
ncbi:jg4026 [Pararge aegeria aegeria]|uniref:Jg4026 protein n=1 Tax=Pararge aegeria aegeria TaxID=348720 RepID=A0A8S4R850_9NEOP|nr:jg4026 [Pararge aegeria aegeria]